MQTTASKTSKWKDFFKKKNNKIEPFEQQNNGSKITNQILNQEANENSTLKSKIEEIPLNKIKEAQQKIPSQTCSRFTLKSLSNLQKQKQQESPVVFHLNQQKQAQFPFKKDKVFKKAKKLLSILQQKKKHEKEPLTQNDLEIKSSNQIQLKKGPECEQKSESMMKLSTKLTKGHYKIYNPEHFNVTEEQVKQSIHRWTYGTGQTPNQLLISSWNVNGIRARMNANDILPYLDFVKPDIFCINEHKMDQKSYLQNPYKFWGYHSYWNFPKYSLGYSGVAVFSKYPAIQMWEDIHIPEHSKEGRVITLEFQKFVLINVYIPTCGRELERLKYRVDQYDPAFRQYVLQLQKKYSSKTLIICGDINVAHKELDCHTGKRMLQGKQPAYTFQERSSFSVFLREAKMIDTFRHFHPEARQYTWWNMRRGGRQRAGETGIGKRLDYFLVDEKSLKFVKSSSIMKKVKGCDHCPIEMKIDFTI